MGEGGASLHHNPPTHDSLISHPPNVARLRNINARGECSQFGWDLLGSRPEKAPQSGSVCLLPDRQQLVQQISGGGEQSPSCQIQRFPPPRIRAQSGHDPAAVPQRAGDDVPVERELLIGAQQPGGEAQVLAKVNHKRPRPGEADAPVHALRLRPLSAWLWQLGASSAGASWVQRAAGTARRVEEPSTRHKHPARSLSS